MAAQEKWTDAQIELLRKLRAEGASFTLIAERIGGVSRSACIGKAARLGLPRIERPTQAKQTHKPRGPRFRLKRTPQFRNEPKPEIVPPPAFIGIPFSDLKSGECRYPRGEGASMLFCGLPVVEETSWCAHCSNIVFDRNRTATSRRKAKNEHLRRAA